MNEQVLYEKVYPYKKREEEEEMNKEERLFKKGRKSCYFWSIR
jgi:hypothetical protein